MRALVFVVILVAVVAAALFFLSSRAHEVPTHPVEVDVTNAATS